MEEEAPAYNTFAKNYDKVWTLPYMKSILRFFSQTIHSLRLPPSSSALDLACGTGPLLRLVYAVGVKQCVGIDISTAMIDIAQSQGQNPEDVCFHVADCFKPLDRFSLQPSSFDIVTGGWLLHYAKNSAEMRAMWDNVAKYLKPGGVFVGLMHSYSLPPKLDTVSDHRFGCRWSDIEPLENGQGVRMKIDFDTEPKIRFDNWQLEKTIVEKGAREAGMYIVEYKQPGVDTLEDEQLMDMKRWGNIIEQPPNQIIIARKIE